MTSIPPLHARIKSLTEDRDTLRWLLAEARWNAERAAAAAYVPPVTVPADALVWVALDNFDHVTVLTTPQKSRAEVQEYLDYQCDDVDGHPAVITVGTYLCSGGYSWQHGAAITRAVEGFVADADKPADGNTQNALYWKAIAEGWHAQYLAALDERDQARAERNKLQAGGAS